MQAQQKITIIITECLGMAVRRAEVILRSQLFDEITIIPWLKLTYVFDPQIFMEKHKEKRDELLFSSNI